MNDPKPLKQFGKYQLEKVVLWHLGVLTLYWSFSIYDWMHPDKNVWPKRTGLPWHVQLGFLITIIVVIHGIWRFKLVYRLHSTGIKIQATIDQVGMFGVSGYSRSLQTTIRYHYEYDKRVYSGGVNAVNSRASVLQSRGYLELIVDPLRPQSHAVLDNCEQVDGPMY